MPGEYYKSGKDHVIPIVGPLVAIIERRRAARAIKSEGASQLSRFIFHRGDAQKITEFRRSWRTACREAGVGNRLFHDLRRSFARRMTLCGVPEKITMALGGWQTRSVFDRYAIVSPDDVADAMRKVEASGQ